MADATHRPSAEEPDARPPVLEPGYTFGTVTDKISSLVLTRPYNWRWFLGFGISFCLMMMLLLSIGMIFVKGIGVWGLKYPVMWAFDITNFVWWVGIGHAGTLISAILLLLKQDWRTSINRFAEAMTLFAVACAGIFPLIHLGRPWVFYWLMPYLNTMGMWPQWRSPLIWDVFAVSTYATVSLLFWYIGLVPDLATLRDRSTNKYARIIYGIGAMGWRGSARHWHRYRTSYLLMAGLATPLVVSVHTIVSFDFTVGIVPGWHSTIFPPYFVAGAIFSGFAMVLTLTIPLRRVFGLKDFITGRHLENMAKVILTTGLIVTYGYFMEGFMAWYGNNPYEIHTLLKERPRGSYAHTYWQLILCNCIIPQLLWIKWIRNNPITLWIISIVVNIGMWLERYIIIVVSLHADYVPSSWRMFNGTVWDYTTFYGSVGLFFTLLFLFIRFLPVISIAEMRELVHEKAGHGEGNGGPTNGQGGTMSDHVDPNVEPKPHGLLAMFLSPEDVLRAAKAAYAQGFRKMDAYSPLPVDGLAEAIGFTKNRIPLVVFISGLMGGIGGYALQYYSAVINYPIDIGGRPYHSWPAFIPITFETTVLMAAFGAVFGMLGLNGLPRPHHPIFNVPRFALASRSRFFLCILADDPLFDLDGTTKFLEGLNPREVTRVER